jgi:hypothetical protein
MLRKYLRKEKLQNCRFNWNFSNTKFWPMSNQLLKIRSNLQKLQFHFKAQSFIWQVDFFATKTSFGCSEFSKNKWLVTFYRGLNNTTPRKTVFLFSACFWMLTAHWFDFISILNPTPHYKKIVWLRTGKVIVFLFKWSLNCHKKWWLFKVSSFYPSYLPWMEKNRQISAQNH